MTNSVCVAVDHKYDDSMGSYSIFYMFDGEKVSIEGGMYSNMSFDHYTVNATDEQICEAAKVYNDSVEESNNYNKYANGGTGAYTYVGCIVKLSRSRKAPNKKELKVVAFNDRYYNDYYGNWVSETIDLLDEETGTVYQNISIGCIKEVVQGVKEEIWWTPAK